MRVWFAVRRPVRRAWYAGRRVECPLCERRFRRFARAPSGLPLECPWCWSLPRHRLLWLYLRDRGLLDRPGVAVLHVAPELGVARRLRSLPGVRYVGVDLESPWATVRADVTALPFDDESFDLVLCSHVLEHVPDDRAAMRELARVLRRDGQCVVQAPVNYEQTSGTYEDVRVTAPDERLRRFSQRDHVRVYGPDLRDRLEEAGFAVVVEPYFEHLDDHTIDRMALAPWLGPIRNDLYSCTRRT